MFENLVSYCKLIFLKLTKGTGKISTWADFVTMVTMPGPAILDALRMVQKEEKVQLGALIVAQMSCKGILIIIEKMANDIFEVISQTIFHFFLKVGFSLLNTAKSVLSS